MFLQSGIFLSRGNIWGADLSDCATFLCLNRGMGTNDEGTRLNYRRITRVDASFCLACLCWCGIGHSWLAVALVEPQRSEEKIPPKIPSQPSFKSQTYSPKACSSRTHTSRLSSLWQVSSMGRVASKPAVGDGAFARIVGAVEASSLPQRKARTS